MTGTSSYFKRNILFFIKDNTHFSTEMYYTGPTLNNLGANTDEHLLLTTFAGNK
jgi:hypothetical protein